MSHTHEAPEGGPLRCLEGGAPRSERPPRVDTREEDADGGGRVLACAFCEHAVTTSASRIEVEGAHEHTFANPAGYAYHIGCFARASGCVPEGPATDAWSWFPPHRWQVGRCAACTEHIGWLFRSPAGGGFYGLILDRLIERGEG